MMRLGELYARGHGVTRDYAKALEWSEKGGHQSELVGDGKRIVTASYNKTVRIWDAPAGKLSSEPLKGHEGAVYSAAFSPDGKRIVTASQDKTARIWDVFPDTQALVSAAKAAVSRCLTPTQARPSSCRPSRRPGASRWRSGPTTRPNGNSGSPTRSPPPNSP